MTALLIDFLVNDLIPDDEHRCLIAKVNEYGGFSPDSPALLTRLSDFERGHRSEDVTIGKGNYRFFGRCADIYKRRPGSWSRATAEEFINYISYISALEIMRETYSKMRAVDPNTLPLAEQKTHLQELADLEAVMVVVERGYLEFNPGF